MSRPALMIVTAATLAAGAAAPARADTPPIAWQAPPGCPGADELTAKVVAQLGRALRPGEIDARLEVSRRGARWRVDMTVRTGAGDGERSLEAGSCDELADAAALIVALTIDPDAGLAGEDAEIEIDPPEVAASAEEAAADRADGDDELPPAPDLERRYVDVQGREPSVPVDVDLRIRALVAGDLGSMPHPAVGFGGALELAFDAWSVDVAGQHFAAQQALLPGMPDKGADVDLTSVVVRGCYASGPRRWRAGGCVGGEAWVMGAAGFRFTENVTTTTYGGGLHTGATWAVDLIGPLTLRADLTATWMIVRPVLTEAGGAVIHDPNVLVWRGVAAVEAVWR